MAVHMAGFLGAEGDGYWDQYSEAPALPAKGLSPVKLGTGDRSLSVDAGHLAGRRKAKAASARARAGLDAAGGPEGHLPGHVEEPWSTEETAAETKALARSSSGGFWESDTWDPDQRVYVGAADGGRHHLDAVVPKDPQLAAAAAPAEPAPAASAVEAAAAPSAAVANEAVLQRSNSNGFWEADAWDPDERVYVGASAGYNHHLSAAAPKDSSPGNNQAAIPSVAQQWAHAGEGEGEDEDDDEGGYWDTAQWDADSRVYVGAGQGQQLHQMAVLPWKA